MRLDNKKKFSLLRLPLILLVFTSSSFAFLPNAYTPRFLGWLLAGSTEMGRVDGLVPIYANSHDLVFTNIQGEVATDNAWLGSFGVGVRHAFFSNEIIGSYFFLDRNVSTAHNKYVVSSVGVEAMNFNLGNTFWDARVNAYLPVSDRIKKGESYFVGGCEATEFHGHQQFTHRFFNFEEVGPGADTEIAMHLPFLNDTSLYAGAYYYQLKDVNDIKGLEARVELPVKWNVALTVEASYDNQQRAAVLAGFEYHFGANPRFFSPNAYDRLYDRVPRNLATVKTGSGIPVIKATKDEGLFLLQDNIYFFTATGGTLFDGTTNSGTFENPLAASQFNQATLSALSILAPGADLYFSPGVYAINSPNSRINLLLGQSMFGRDIDYKCPAVGDDRPVFLGGINLYEGYNQLDSVQILNRVSQSAIGTNFTLIGLDINNAANIFLTNDVISVNSTIFGDNANENNAIGIRTNNSQITIDPTVIDVGAIVTGNNLNNASVGAVGIGNVDGATRNNIVRIDDCRILVTAFVAQDNNNSANIAVGIGNLVGLANNVINVDFTNNQFTINNSEIHALADVNSSGEGGSFATNESIAIGLGSGVFPSNFNLNFTNNIFLLSNNMIIANATVLTDNTGASSNEAVGIGLTSGIVTGFNSHVIDQSFTNNSFNISGTQIDVSSMVNHSNNFGSTNQTSVVGVLGGVSNSFINLSNNFSNNIFYVDKCVLNSVSGIALDNQNASNLTQGIGIIPAQGGGGTETSTFNNNIFSIDYSLGSFIARIRGTNDNSSFNDASSVGFIDIQGSGVTGTHFDNNVLNIYADTFNSQAEVFGLNNVGATNEANGFRVGNNNQVGILSSKINLTAGVGGGNLGADEATDLFGEFGTVYNVLYSTILIKNHL